KTLGLGPQARRERATGPKKGFDWSDAATFSRR
ncbi:hypothetical protein AK812_SmicGene48690, partial [Symbiodinium microadriaticum]